MSAERTQSVSAIAGLAAGPAVWAVHQQVGYMLVPLSCELRIAVLPLLAFVCIGLVLASGLVSWRALSRFDKPEQTETGNSTSFLARLSVLFAILFAFAILLQGSATLFLDACQR